MKNERLQRLSAINPAFNDDSREPYELNENSMARLFAELYSDVVCYCPEKKSWFFYDGIKWSPDVGETEVSSAIRNFTSLVGHYAADLINTDNGTAKNWSEIFKKLGDRRFRDRLMRDARDDLCVPVTVFDSKPLLLNCKNYTYNLATKKLQPHNWQDYITHEADFEFDAKAKKCDRWEQFIDEVMCGDKQATRFLQKCLGYSVSGEANQNCMFVLYGKTTRNGKSTLLDTIQHLLGDYSTTTSVALICARGKADSGPQSASPVTAALKGKRFVTMAESDEYGRLNESAVKQFTGGEQILARGLYEKPFTFKPQFCMWLSCNDLPAVSDKSVFASERIKVFEFNRHFSATEQDKDLSAQFRTPEAKSAIFLWLAKGYKAYKEEGLEPPDSVRQAIKSYEKSNDLVGQFAEESVLPGGEVSLPDLYRNFETWIKSTGFERCRISRKKFASEFRAHKELYAAEVNVHNVAVFKGIHLK